MTFPEPKTLSEWNRENKFNRSWVFDLEADGLLPEASKVWVLVLLDTKTLETFVFSDYDKNYPNLEEGLWTLQQASKIVGHHILGYDLVLLARLFGKWFHKPLKTDTLILSKVLDYRRFGSRHGLQHWGNFLGYPKVKHEDWSQYSPEMLKRCVEDVRLNFQVYKTLLKELSNWNPKTKSKIIQGLQAEHGLSEFVGRSWIKGWCVDRSLMEKTLKELYDILEPIRQELEPQLKPVIRVLDKEPKETNFIKTGDYALHTSRWFSLDRSEAQSPLKPIEGRFSRVDYHRAIIGNKESLKEFLESKGWKPDEWNWKKEGRKFIKLSPKMTQASLKKVEYWGPKVLAYNTLSSRYNVLKTWLENLDTGDSLLGDLVSIGTPTGRVTHKSIANIPNAEPFSRWILDRSKEEQEVCKGFENPYFEDESTFTLEQRRLKKLYNESFSFAPAFRSFFKARDGYTLVGSDSKSCQVRALCHYLKNDEYTDLVISGNVHQFHQDLLKDIYPDVTKSSAKRVYFALIFGASNTKLGNYLIGVDDSDVGKQIRATLLERIVGLKDLTAKISKVCRETQFRTGKSFVRAVDSRPIYVLSDHTGLNYVLQSCEAVVCKQAATDALQELDFEIGPDNWNPLIFYHDEIVFEVKSQFSEKAKVIASEAFATGARKFGVTIMEGESKLGNTWLQVH